MDRTTLLQLTMQDIRVTLRGYPMPQTALTSQIRVTGTEEFSLTVLGAPTVLSDGIYTGAPLIRQQRIQMTARAAGEISVCPPLEDAVTETWTDGYLLTGFLPLQEQIGPTELILQGAAGKTLQIRFEVFPSRVFWREDHNALEAEVQQLVRLVAADALAKLDPAFGLADLSDDAILASIMESYNAFLEISDEILAQLERKPMVWLPKRRAAYDTAENRLTKYLLRTAARHLCQLPATEELDARIGELNRRAGMEVLSHVGVYRAGEETKPAAMAPEYQVLYQHYLRLAYGTALLTVSLHFTSQQLPQLYGYWCYLKLAELLRTRYELRVQTAVHLHRGSLALPMLTGQPVCMEFAGPAEDRLLLSLREGPQITLQGGQQPPAVFLPRYRVSAAGAPTAEDLDEALQIRNQLFYDCRTAVPGVCVLFPGEDGTNYRHSAAYRALCGAGLGGIPLLPGQTETAQRLLDKLVCGVPMLDYDEIALPEELALELEAVDWNRRGVLIGAMRNPEQLALCLKNRFYHVPAHLVEQSAHPITHVALYQSKHLFGQEAGIRYYGEVAEYNAVPRYTIREIHSYSQEIYYRFEIRQWHTLPEPIRVQDAGGVVKLTNLFLLQNSRVDTSLQIASEEMFLLQFALQQALETATAEGEFGFRLSDCMVALCQGVIQVFRDHALQIQIPVTEYRRRPGRCLERLYQCIFDDSNVKEQTEQKQGE